MSGKIIRNQMDINKVYFKIVLYESYKGKAEFRIDGYSSAFFAFVVFITIFGLMFYVGCNSKHLNH